MQAVVFLTFGLLAISSSSVLTKLCTAPALTIALYRVLMAALIYGTAAAVRGIPRPLLRKSLKPAMLSGFFLAVHFAVWITSLRFTSVASSVVLVVTSPVWAALGGLMFAGERPSVRMIVGIALALIGTIIVTGLDFALEPRRLFGNLLALTGAVAAAGYWMTGKKLRADLDTPSAVSLVYGACALFTLVPVLLLRIPVSGFAPRTWIYLAAIALVPQVIGHTSLNWALKYLSATAVAVITLGEPVGASLLANIFLGEKITLTQAAGGAVILLGVASALKAEAEALR